MVTLVLNTAAGGVCEAMWTRFSLPQRRRDSWKRMKVDESDYTDYTQKHCPRSKLSLWCRAKAPQCHQRWTGYITSRDSLDDKPTNSYKFTQIHSCLPTFCIRTWLGILVVPSEVKKGKRLRESWAKKWHWSQEVMLLVISYIKMIQNVFNHVIWVICVFHEIHASLHFVFLGWPVRQRQFHSQWHEVLCESNVVEILEILRVYCAESWRL